MALEAFGAKMTALADAVRAKFGLTGALTVADMVTAVSGLEYASAGNTLAGFNADMFALGDAIRGRSGVTGSLTIDKMAEAVAAISLGYTSFVDESLCESVDISYCNRVTVTLPAGTYSDFEIYGVGKEPIKVVCPSNAFGSGTEVSFTYIESGGIVRCGTISGGRLVIFNDGGGIGASPSSNFGAGFEFPTVIKGGNESDTGMTRTIKSGYCLMIKFSAYTA